MTGMFAGWAQYLVAGVLVMVRLSGLMVFAPVFNSNRSGAADQGRVRVCVDNSAGAGGGGGAQSCWQCGCGVECR